MKIKKQKKISKKMIIIGAICALLLIGAGTTAAYWYISRNKTDTQSNTNTETEIGKNNPENKDTPGENNPVENTTDKENSPEQGSGSQLSSVTPFINYFGRTGTQLEVNAIVPNINEGGGVCTLTVRDQANTVVYTASKPAHSGPQTTRCENFLFPDTGASGTWKAVVSYKSTTYSGDSQATAFN